MSRLAAQASTQCPSLLCLLCMLASEGKWRGGGATDRQTDRQTDKQTGTHTHTHTHTHTQAHGTCSPCSSNAVRVRVNAERSVKVDDRANGRDVQPSCRHICRHQNAGLLLAVLDKHLLACPLVDVAVNQQRCTCGGNDA